MTDTVATADTLSQHNLPESPIVDANEYKRLSDLSIDVGKAVLNAGIVYISGLKTRINATGGALCDGPYSEDAKYDLIRFASDNLSAHFGPLMRRPQYPSANEGPDAYINTVVRNINGAKSQGPTTYLPHFDYPQYLDVPGVLLMSAEKQSLDEGATYFIDTAQAVAKVRSLLSQEFPKKEDVDEIQVVHSSAQALRNSNTTRTRATSEGLRAIEVSSMHPLFPKGTDAVFSSPVTSSHLLNPYGEKLLNSADLLVGIHEILTEMPRYVVKIKEGDAVVCNNIRYLHGAAGKPPDQGGTREPRKLYVMHFAGL